MKELWFDPVEIIYTKRQLQFLLVHLHALEAGCWPDIENEVVISGSGIPYIGSYSARAKMAYKPNPDAERVANELNERLKLCGRDGQIAKARYADGKNVKGVCKMFDLARWMIFHCSNKCLKYMEGKHRRKIPYSQWKV